MTRSASRLTTVGDPVALGLVFAAILLVLGAGAGSRQFATLRRVRDEPHMPEIDRRYYRGQARRRLTASALMFVIGLMIGAYYLSGMDARMDAIPERNKGGEPPPPDDPQVQSDKAFTRFVGGYVIVMVVLLGIVVFVALLDYWATRVYWLARYQEIRADHETKLRRDLAVFRRQKLNSRVPGLKPPTDDTTPEGDPPVS